MAQIDLSRFTPNIQVQNREQQVFTGEDSNAYKAMAGLGENMAKIATDFHDKELDIFTDREALNATDKLKQTYAQESARALQNIDENNFVVGDDGESTQKTYDQHMSDFLDENMKATTDGLSENISKVKFATSTDRWASEQKVASIFKNSEMVTKNSIESFDKGISSESDNVLYSNAADNEKNLAQAMDNLQNKEGAILLKTAGLTAYNKSMEDAKKKLYESSMEAYLREMKTDPNAATFFSHSIGLGIIFKKKDDVSKYMIQKYSDVFDEMPDKEEINQLADLLTNGNAGGPDGQTDQYGKPVQFNPNPLSDTLSPDEKRKYLDRALDIMFKDKAEKKGNIKTQVSNWQAAPSAGPMTVSQKDNWLNVEAPKIFNDPNYSGDNTKKVNDVYKAVDMMIVQEAKENLINKGSRGFDNFLNNVDSRRRSYADLIIGNIMSPEDYKKVMSDYPSTGKASVMASRDALLNLQRETNLDMNTRPMKFVQQSPTYSSLSGQAIKVDGAGNIVVNQKALEHLDSFTKQTLNTMGTAQSAMDSKNILTPKLMDDVMNNLNIMSPDKQLDVVHQINKGNPALATAVYTQAVKQGKMTLEQASLAANSQIGDSKTAQAMTGTLIALNNKYTGPVLDKTIEDMKTKGWLGKDKSFNDVKNEMNKQIADNEYLNNLKETAKASGMSDASINIMFENKNIQKLTLEKLSKTLQEDPSFMDKAIPGRFGDKVKSALESAVNEFYGSRMTPIVGNNIHAITMPNTVSDTDKINQRATALSEMVQKRLADGTLKVDFSDYQGMQQAQKYKGLSDSVKQKYFLRDVGSSVSFNGADVTGKSDELIGMFKDPSSGAYYRMKLKDQNGKAYVPVISNAREFEHNDENALFQKYFQGAIVTKQLGTPNKTPISSRGK